MYFIVWKLYFIKYSASNNLENHTEIIAKKTLHLLHLYTCSCGFLLITKQNSPESASVHCGQEWGMLSWHEYRCDIDRKHLQEGWSSLSTVELWHTHTLYRKRLSSIHVVLTKSMNEDICLLESHRGKRGACWEIKIYGFNSCLKFHG